LYCVHLFRDAGLCWQCATLHGPDLSEIWEKFAIDALPKANIPGANNVIVSCDHVVFAKGLGLSNRRTVTPMTPENCCFRIDCSKILAATYGQLSRQGTNRSY